MKNMYRKIILVAVLSAVINSPSYADNTPKKSPELLVVENFYKNYFEEFHKSSKTHPFHEPMIPLSHAFKKLVELDTATCKAKAKGDVCGWGADGLIFLKAQEYDPDLNFENSGFTATESKPHTVEVTLNVYPSIKEAGKFYDRNFKFQMIRENGQWVVDDILSDEKSERQWIEYEIKTFQVYKK